MTDLLHYRCGWTVESTALEMCICWMMCMYVCMYVSLMVLWSVIMMRKHRVQCNCLSQSIVHSLIMLLTLQMLNRLLVYFNKLCAIKAQQCSFVCLSLTFVVGSFVPPETRFDEPVRLAESAFYASCSDCAPTWDFASRMLLQAFDPWHNRRGCALIVQDSLPHQDRPWMV